jgi:GTP-binding protein
MGNLVAIVGRPNVGKSTLFNRLTESRKAIVGEEAGVTRDRHYAEAEWCGTEYSLVDTGGYVQGSDDVFEGEIRKQVKIAIEEANIILFLVDVTIGIADLDIEVANLLRRSKKKVFVVANKVDNSKRMNDLAEFYRFGLGEIFPISSINGSGTGELLDAMVEAFDKDAFEEKLNLPKIAIIGQPNVGKSSLTNALIGFERTIVTPIAGTTRDTIKTRCQGYGHDFFLVDTAGLRKKAKVSEDIEFYSVMRTIRAIEEADVCILMIDATHGGIEAQDLSIFHLIEKNKKGGVILVNKWDLVEKNTNSTKEFEAKIKAKIAPFTDVPIIFTSVETKQRIFKALETAIEVFDNKKKKISTSQLNKTMLPIIEAFPVPASRGRLIKIKYITQLPTNTPSFAFFCNSPKEVPESYKRFLENKIRDNYDFSGVPISIYLRDKDGNHED